MNIKKKVLVIVITFFVIIGIFFAVLMGIYYYMSYRMQQEIRESMSDSRNLTLLTPP
jgi:flagellar basal body-associated protein FliL